MAVGSAIAKLLSADDFVAMQFKVQVILYAHVHSYMQSPPSYKRSFQRVISHHSGAAAVCCRNILGHDAT